MCIICRKETGVPLDEQSWKWLKNSFDNNDDGAGFMYRLNNSKIRIFKGFMTWDAFKDAVMDKLDTINAKEVIFHFRIGTSGTMSQAMCHPFPICRSDSKLGQTKVKCDAALVHNGIISGYGDREFSDTHVFVRDVLTQIPYKTKAMRSLMANALHSKFMIMDSATTYMMGEFEKEKGWMFSNNSYKREPYVKPVGGYTYYGSGYGSEDDGKYTFPTTVPTKWWEEEDKLAIPIYDAATHSYVEPVLCATCEYTCLPDEVGTIDGYEWPEGDPVFMCELCVEFYTTEGLEVFAEDLDRVYGAGVQLSEGVK